MNSILEIKDSPDLVYYNIWFNIYNNIIYLFIV